MKIIFLAPEEYVGLTGYQNVDPETNAVTSVTFEDGSEVPNDPGYSYKGADDA
jgi:hypothetical protein